MKLVIWIIKLFRFIIGYFIKPLILLAYKFYYRKIDKSRPLKETYNPLLFFPAVELAKKLRRKEVNGFI